MKKTFQVNINGKIFHIDEDAYTLLQNYLSQLRATFPGEEGLEIVSDIECRISEHFDRIVAGGSSAIVIENVNHVIGIMGRPDEISDEANLEPEQSSANVPPRPAPAPPPSRNDTETQNDADPTPPPFHKKLFRDDRHKVFGGVLAGLGQYFNWDITVLRILVIIATIFLIGADLFGITVIAYLICWMVIPPARSPRQILEMRGEPVTIDNVGQTVMNASVPPSAPVPGGNEFTRFINTVFLVIGRVILILLGVIGGIIAMSTGIVGLVIIAGMCCLFFGAEGTLLEAMDISLHSPYTEGWALTLTLFAIMIPALSLGWAGISQVTKSPKMSTTAIVSLVVLEILLIIGAAVLFNLGGDSYLDFAGNLVPIMASVSMMPTVLG